MLSESDRKKLIAVNINLMFLQLNSCTCQVKTPDADYHHKECRYRLAKDSAAMVCAVLKNTENKNGN